tara:strand:- start:355 stop:483 length:129 start_codon:yes stop_codon:yes gene_type:complete
MNKYKKLEDKLTYQLNKIYQKKIVPKYGDLIKNRKNKIERFK